MAERELDACVLTEVDMDRLVPPEKTELPQQALGIEESSVLYPAVHYVCTHPGTPVSMLEMARLCHLSPCYFSRLFTREMGMGFISYVNLKNVEIAKKELLTTSKSVSQIALDLGYLNISHFIKLFKRFEGVTPLVYRQQK